MSLVKRSLLRVGCRHRSETPEFLVECGDWLIEGMRGAVTTAARIPLIGYY
jgi:hypothetical protein